MLDVCMYDYIFYMLVLDIIVGTSVLISRCFLPCKVRWKGCNGSSLLVITDGDNLKLK